MGKDCMLFLFKSMDEFISIDLDRLYVFSSTEIPTEKIIASPDLKDIIIDKMDNYCDWYDNICAPFWRYMYWMSKALDFIFWNKEYEKAIIVSEDYIDYSGDRKIEEGSKVWYEVKNNIMV